jgi:trigger factor
VSTIEEVSNTKRKIRMEIPVEESGPAFEEAFELVSNSAKMKGFRPGKLPRPVIIKQFGNQIRQHMIEGLISKKILGDLQERQIHPLSTPILESLTVNEGEPVALVANFDVYPTFDLPSLEGVEIFKRIEKITDDNVDQAIEELRAKQASLRTIDEDRPAVDGDVAEIQYVVLYKDKPVALESGESPIVNLPVGRTGGRDDKISTAVVGLRKGETVDVPVLLPRQDERDKKPAKGKKRSQNISLAGKKVIFRVTLNKIRVRELPALDDEFAKDTGFPDVTDLKTLREFIVQELNKKLEANSEKELRDRVLALIASKATIEVPESVLDIEIEAALEEYRKSIAERDGKPVDPKTPIPAGYKAGLRRNCEVYLKQLLVVEKIKFERDVAMTEEDLEKSLINVCHVSGHDFNSMKNFYKEGSENLKKLKDQIENSKALDYLLSLVKVTESDDPNDFQPLEEYFALQTPAAKAAMNEAMNEAMANALADADAEAESREAEPKNDSEKAVE